jgi:hypothetical protein
VTPVRHVAGKWFATFYALYSGVAFLGIAGLLIAPVAHRLLHSLHVDEEDEEGEDKKPSSRSSKKRSATSRRSPGAAAERPSEKK